MAALRCVLLCAHCCAPALQLIHRALRERVDLSDVYPIYFIQLLYLLTVQIFRRDRCSQVEVCKSVRDSRSVRRVPLAASALRTSGVHTTCFWRDFSVFFALSNLFFHWRRRPAASVQLGRQGGRPRPAAPLPHAPASHSFLRSTLDCARTIAGRLGGLHVRTR